MLGELHVHGRAWQAEHDTVTSQSSRLTRAGWAGWADQVHSSRGTARTLRSPGRWLLPVLRVRP